MSEDSGALLHKELMLPQHLQKLGNILLCCSQKAVTFIRHEHIEAQTVKAFHIFARTVKVLFKTGAAIQLRRLGYKFHKVTLDRSGMKPLN